jgi:hypothetical protein
MATSRSAYGV